MEPISNNTAALSVNPLLASKNMSKKRNGFASGSSSLRIHSQGSNEVSGLFVQENESINYVPVNEEPFILQDNILDFLPEKVVLMASCNGILCCRRCTPKFYNNWPGSQKETLRPELAIYLCNPATKEWIALDLDGFNGNEAFGLAFSQFGSPVMSRPSFRLVSVKHLEGIYSFSTYSSKRQRWTTSREVCHLSSNLYLNKMVFANGRFHWLTWNLHVMTFDVEREVAQVVKLPGVFSDKDLSRLDTCLGSSDGCFHFVCAYQLNIKIWILQDYGGPNWVLKHSLPMLDLWGKHSHDTLPMLGNVNGYFPDDVTDVPLKPLAFEEEVLFIRSGGSIFSYNIKTRRLGNLKQSGNYSTIDPIVLPYTHSSTSLCNFKDSGALCSENRSTRKRRKLKYKASFLFHNCVKRAYCSKNVEPFRNNDIATQVLSRLPVKSLMAFKCTSKKWNAFVSDSSFLRLHSRSSKAISGLFAHALLDHCTWDSESVYYIDVDKEPSAVQDTFLDFLPEKVVLLNSSNGILCVRSCITQSWVRRERLRFNKKDLSKTDVVIYICNPATKERFTVEPNRLHEGQSFGLAFYPSGSSSTFGPSFKLVSLQRSLSDPGIYTFTVYSSETQEWTASEQVCKFSSNVHWDKVCFVNGRFHWLTWNHHVITFDVEREVAQVMKLPGLTPYENDQCRVGICFGNSEGNFHHVCSYKFDVKIWMLTDYSEPNWVLKHKLPLIEFCRDYGSKVDTYSVLRDMEGCDPECTANDGFLTLAFEDDVLFTIMGECIVAYNFRTRTLVNHCSVEQFREDFCGWGRSLFPYTASLTPLSSVKGAGDEVIKGPTSALRWTSTKLKRLKRG